jgi:hypothetical protein
MKDEVLYPHKIGKIILISMFSDIRRGDPAKQVAYLGM